MKKNEFFRWTDVIRVVGLIFATVFIIVIHLSVKVDRETKRFLDEDAHAKWLEEDSQKQLEIMRAKKAKDEWWDSKSADEKFVWSIWNFDNGENAIRDIYIDDTRNAIIIYVPGARRSEMKEADLNAYIDYEKIMSQFAKASDVTKTVYVVGQTNSGESVWYIDEYGHVIDY